MIIGNKDIGPITGLESATELRHKYIFSPYVCNEETRPKNILRCPALLCISFLIEYITEEVEA